MMDHLLRSLPTFKGKQRLARLLLRKKIASGEGLTVTGKWGCVYNLPNVQENIGFEILINGIYEEETINFICKRIKPGGVFLDVGVVLYNGHIPNYIYNAPNKLFEYLACGLDVWFPDVMAGSMDYVNKNGFPKVLSIDFNNLNKFDLAAAIERQGSESKYLFFCEEALKPLIDKLTQL